MIDVGVTFPNELLGTDRVALHDYVQAVEEMGYGHVAAVDHVVGTPHSERHHGPYTHESLIHEPFILSAYILARTERLKCITSILILTQRQTVLVAKQAAELAVLSGDRMVLGVAVGYQPWEFEALDVDYRRRGARLEEQIAVLRRLWSEPLVTFEGEFHQLHDVAILPRPERGAIPLWIGGGGKSIPSGDRISDPAPVLRRVGRIGDGWMVVADSVDDFTARRAVIREAAAEAGRDPDEVQMMQFSFRLDDRPAEQRAEQLHRWESAGVTHASVAIPDASAPTLSEHLKKLRAFAEAFEFEGAST